MSVIAVASIKPRDKTPLFVPSPYLQYLAGMTLIQNTPQLDSASRSLRFGELEGLTGLNAGQFAAWVRSFKNRPRDWKKVTDSTIQIFDKGEQSWQTKTSVNLPTRILKPKP
ncbi:MAG: hypothetical protein PHC61_17985 [Chitinivibrionales bacterium]|nr:hypothetical protein [Chitinivibrionales bacterium]